MQLQAFATELEFKHPFVLAAGTRTHTPVIFMRLELNGIVSWAEAAFPPYFGLGTDEVIKLLKSLPLRSPEFNFFNVTMPDDIAALIKKIPAPVVALLSNLYANYNRSFNFDPVDTPCTLTVSASPGVPLEELLAEKDRFNMIKIKAGTGNDEEFIKATVEKSGKRFCIDVNRGWKNRDEAATLCEKLEKMGCVLIEQPFAVHDFDSTIWLRERTSIPVIADESICTIHDLVHLDAFDGVNVKFLKCGGMGSAQKIIGTARQKNKIILLGCMSESSLGCATSARLAHAVDYVDLDGPYLIKNDPFTGYSIENGKIKIAETGIQPTNEFISRFSVHAVTL